MRPRGPHGCPRRPGGLRERPLSPLWIRRFVRARLHRRLFVWFGAAIAITAALVVVAAVLLERSGNSGWSREVARAQAFVGHQFERVWDAPADRDALARGIRDDLDIDLELLDAQGATLAKYGGGCGRRSLRAPVRRDGADLGAVVICPDRSRRGSAIRVILPLALIAVALWAAAGVLSRRLARPLSELARVAREIGDGKLDSRVRLDCRQHGEVGVVAEAVNDMAARIERQLSDQRELLAAVSHELRTPLARIRLLTEMARDNAAGRSLLDDLDREVIEIDALVGDLLASSRLDFAALTLSRLGPAEVAIRALERAGLDPTLLEVEEPAPPAFEADATLLGRALANLIDNARAHGGGVERLRVREAAGGLAFEVEDRGPGFAEGEERRVFEPFYRRARGGDERRERGSLGLGLALCKRIAEAHGGRAYAETREGGGARVGFEIALRPPGSEASG